MTDTETPGVPEPDLPDPDLPPEPDEPAGDDNEEQPEVVPPE